MAAYLLAIGNVTGQLTASLRLGHTQETTRTLPNAAARRSFFGALLSALAAWPC